MDKEAEANGENGQAANRETGGDIVHSEFTEKREGRKVIILGALGWTKNSTVKVKVFFHKIKIQTISDPKVHTYSWLPAGKPKALLFLCHG